MNDPHVNYVGAITIGLWDAMAFRVYAQPGIAVYKALLAASSGGSFDRITQPNRVSNFSEWTTAPDRWTGERFHVRYSAIDRSYEIRILEDVCVSDQRINN
jgi:hypothetical protein